MRTPGHYVPTPSPRPFALLVLFNFAIAAGFAALGQVPRIDSVNPNSGPIGTPVTLAGANFGPTPGNNIVYFGAVRALVTSASENSLTAIVPTGATYAPITVTVGGLTAYANTPFVLTFCGGRRIDSSSFALASDIPTTPDGTTAVVAIGDLDGDGKPDLAFTHYGSIPIVSVVRNTSSSGSLTAASFGPQADITVSSQGGSGYGLSLADVDGDGKLDIVVATSTGLAVLRNTSSSTSISFAPAVEFNSYGGNSIAIADIDGDGKPDIVGGGYLLTILRNTSTVGIIDQNSFSPQIVLTQPGTIFGVAVGDLDADGKPDIAAVDRALNTVSIFRNSSIPGNIAFAANVDFATGPNPQQIVIADFDSDGKPDLAVCNSGSDNSSGNETSISVFRNTTSGPGLDQNSFAAQMFLSANSFPQTIAAADLDGDGNLDIIVGGFSETLPAPSPVRALTVLRNSSLPAGNLVFAQRIDFATSLSGIGRAAIGDLDGDGRPDLVAGGFGAAIPVLRNTAGDSEAPTVMCPANVAIGCSVDLLVPVSFVAVATDNCDPAPTVICSPASGSGFPAGTTTVTCTATDASGNHSSCQFTVTRAPLDFNGFLAPIGGADAAGGSFANPLRTFKMKSTIPVSFTASCSGAAVLTGVHRLQVIKYTDATTAGDPIDATPQGAATTGDQFQLAHDQWEFHLDTKATGMSVGIWLLRATLSDGSQHSSWIQVK